MNCKPGDRAIVICGRHYRYTARGGPSDWEPCDCQVGNVVTVVGLVAGGMWTLAEIETCKKWPDVKITMAEDRVLRPLPPEGEVLAFDYHNHEHVKENFSKILESWSKALPR